MSNFVPLVCPIPIFSLSLYILRRRRPAALFLSSYLSVSTYFFPSIYMYFVLFIYLSLSTSFYWSICLCVLCYIDLSISLYVLCSIELSTSVYFFPLIFTSFFPIHYVLFLFKCTSVFCPFSLCSYLVSVWVFNFFVFLYLSVFLPTRSGFGHTTWICIVVLFSCQCSSSV